MSEDKGPFSFETWEEELRKENLVMDRRKDNLVVYKSWMQRLKPQTTKEHNITYQGSRYRNSSLQEEHEGLEMLQ